MTTTAVSGDLRALVRELISELLPQSGLAAEPRSVAITNDGQLNGFVADLISLLDDPVTGSMVRAGHLRFRLDQSLHASSPPEKAGLDGHNVIQIDRGLVSERIVTRAITEQAALVLGPRVVLTPLAREQIRKSSVKVTRRP